MRSFRRGLVCIATLQVFGFIGHSLSAQPAGPLRTQFSAQPTAAQEDATLHDVQLMGSKWGWAVGDRGVTWRTDDGGRTWQFVSAPVEVSLQSVCFLTDQIGWAAGGSVAPYHHTPQGIVLGTEDGGRTWSVRAQRTIPALYHIQFFGLESGVAVGESSAQCPTGVFATQDGGASWQPVPGEPGEGWKAAAFADEHTGYLGGLRGAHSALGGGQVLKSTLSPFGLRSVHAIDLQPGGRGWLVGDGGLVLLTQTSGAAWEEPAQPLPRSLREFFDARCVTSFEEDTWIGGSPGSAIWHSPDGGRSWSAQPVSGSAPLNAVHFSSGLRGCAVGAFGHVATTEDGGQTWRSVRGGRRAALLTIQTQAERVPIRLVTRSAAENGYRTVTALAARHDIGPDGYLDAHVDLRLKGAVLLAGGCDAEINWRLPIAAPGLDEDYDRLLKEWTLLTDGRLPEMMLGGLVAQLRTWRPSVVVIDEPGDNDGAAKLLRQAILHAVAQAADPSRYPEQLATGGLKSWQVSRVFARLPEGEEGSPTIDPYEILPHHNQTLAMASADAVAVLLRGGEGAARREGYRLIYPQADAAAAAGRDFFGGLEMSPGGEARRMLVPLGEFDYEQVEHLAQHQRNFAAWSQRALDDGRMAAQLIGQLQDVIGGAPPDQAALELAALAEQFKRRSQWPLAEETLIELVERYPREPVAADAMSWLLHLWTSQEIGWQRLRGMTSTRSEVTVRPEATQEGVQQAAALLKEDSPLDRVRELSQSADSPLLIQPVGGQLNFGGSEGQRTAEADRWHEQAAALIAALEQQDLACFRSPEVQFTLAALLRHQGKFDESDEIYRQYINDADPLWQRAARGEAWILGAPTESPKPVTRCRRTPVPPVLDGILSDACWQEAQDIELTAPGSANAAGYIGSRGVDSAGALSEPSSRPDEQAIAMLAYDSRYLYFAASIPRAPELPTDPPERAGRTYDADLQGFDQISLQIDVDRDYSTCYRFDVDSRGCTRDACWIDQHWDPRWYVANDGEPRRWTVEAAIPLEELAPAPPGRGQTWGVGIVRTMPTIGVECWTHPSGTVPRPVTFGLLRFE